MPGPGPATQVSTAGGDYPVWRPDGRAILYRGPNQMLMEVPVVATGTSPDVGTPRVLFSLKGSVPWNFLFDVSPDGRRLVMIMESDPDAAPITVILHWRPDGP